MDVTLLSVFMRLSHHLLLPSHLVYPLLRLVSQPVASNQVISQLLYQVY